MATVKPQGWVYAALKMGYLESAVRKWNQLDYQIHFFRYLTGPVKIQSLSILVAWQPIQP